MEGALSILSLVWLCDITAPAPDLFSLLLLRQSYTLTALHLIPPHSKNILEAMNADTRTSWQNQFVWKLACHSVAEELVVHPAMEKHLRNGKEMAEKDRQEDQIVS